MANKVDLEERFIKKYSATTFVTALNTSSHFKNLIAKELEEQLWEIVQEAEQLGNAADVIIDLDSDTFDATLLGGPSDSALHRSLYRQSMFFKELKKIAITLDREGKACVYLQSETPTLRMATTVAPLELDTFNQYVMLHIVPYFKQQWKEYREAKKYQQLHKILEEVVMDKIGGLRESGKEITP